MNITFLLKEFPKPSETFVLSQVEGLIERGHRVSILSLRTPPKHIRGRIPTGLHAIRYAGLSGSVLKNTVRAAGGFVRTLAGHGGHALKRARSLADIILLPHLNSSLIRDADVIIVHFGDLAWQYAQLAERFELTVPFAAVFHGVDVARFLPSRSAHDRGILWDGMTMGLPVSGFWRDRLIGMGCPPEKLTVHHMGIDPDRFQPRQSPPEGRFSLVTVCRLVEKKGIDTTLTALAETGTHALEYHIIGDGPERKRLERLADDLGIAGQVRFHGTQSSVEVASLLARAHAFILTSQTAANGDMEGIPVSLMEAMACGLPVISTRHSGIPELIEDGVSGLLTDERDSSAIAEAIQRLIADRHLAAALGTAARNRVLEAFNTRTLATELDSILAGIISSPEASHD